MPEWLTPPVTGGALSAAEAATALVAALGCGLLIGIERERRKGSGPGRALAGLRSFALVCVLGAACALTSWLGLVAVGALFVAALGVVAYARDRSQDPGVTTEIALLLTYVIGVLCTWSLPLAAAMAVALTALLAARDRLHQFARQWLSAGEVRDGILLSALVLIALPLVPNRPLWGEVLNPYVITQLLALLLAIQSLAHLGRRLLEARRAVALSALASGFVSSTATIASMGLAVREEGASARLMAGGGLLSCVSTQLQILVVAVAVQPAWLGPLLWPALAAGVVALAWGGWLVRGAPAGRVEGQEDSARVGGVASAGEDRMFSLRGAGLVALLLGGVQALVHALDLWLGQAGVLVGTLLASVVDLHSAMAAVFSIAPPQANGQGVQAVLLALAVHAGSKSVTAALSGGRRYLAWLAPGLYAHTALGMAGIWLLGR